MNGESEHRRTTRQRSSEASFGGASVSGFAGDDRSATRSARRSASPRRDRSDRVVDERTLFVQRSNIVLALFAAVAAIVALRLTYIQVFQHDDLAKAGTQQRTRTIVLPAHRGTIYDRNGNVLAMDKDFLALCCNPQQVGDNTCYSVANILVDHLGGEADDYVQSLQADGYFAYLARHVDPDKADAIVEELTEQQLVAGIYTEDDPARVYPFGAIGSQVIGVIPDKDNQIVGSGLELVYDEILRGEPGERVVEVGGKYGQIPISDVQARVKPAVNGTDIVISLDINVQRVAESKIVEGVEQYKAESGSVMVTDPRTGEILAACSTPLFDLSDRSVVEEGATSLKLVSSSYEPGSIVKVLTTAIALESGAVSPSTVFYVPWMVQVGDDIVTDDDDRSIDMYMDLREILRRSSNAGAAVVAQDYIGADAFAQGVADFGLGQPTGIDYPGEEKGFVKTRDQYDGSSLGSMSFGQGLSVPIVQMVRAVGAVANDGIPITPHFLVSKNGEEVAWPAGEPIVSPATAHMVVDLMRTVVQEGTAEEAQVEGYDVAGKTGTGEIADTVRGGYKEGSYTSSLIGFAQASDPTVLVYVGLNGTPHLAASSAAPLFSSIMSEALVDMSVLPSY